MNIQTLLQFIALFGSAAGSIVGQSIGGKVGGAITSDSQFATELLNIANQALAIRAQVTGEDITTVRGMLHQLPVPGAPIAPTT